MYYKVNQLGYGKKIILEDIEIQLELGQVLGLVAPNGRGKSTLFKGMMNRLSSNDSIITIGEETFNYPLNANDETDLFKNISIMPDQSSLIDHVSGWEHLKFVQTAWNSKVDLEIVVKNLKMESYIKKKVSDYSLGMRQRLCFALQIVMDTRIMLMDEVMNSLDVMNVEMISRMLLQLKASGKIILIASHLLENLIGYSDQVLFIIDVNHSKLVYLNEDSERFFKVELFSKEDEIMREWLKQYHYIESLPAQYMKEFSKVSHEEFEFLMSSKEVRSLTLSPKTLTELYYDLYIEK